MAFRRGWLFLLCFLAACSGGGGGVGPPSAGPSSQPTLPPPSLAHVSRISSDPFSNASSQHATQVEASAAAFGLTVVTAFQTGRFFDYGSSDIGVATSLDGGITWQSTMLPGTTRYALPPGAYDSISDPAVTYDRAHAQWLIAALPIILSNTSVPGVLVSRSSDGLAWANPIAVTGSNETTNDKDWIVCDNHPASPYFGRCYVEWDSYSGNGVIFMSFSDDGGATWSAPARVPGNAGGIGGQPVVQPNGTVIVPIDDLNVAHVLAFSSHDGGATWSTPVTIASIADHAEPGLRSLSLISATIDAAGTVYVVWQDCRFRPHCASNDLVLSTSHDGVQWKGPDRIPIDAITGTVDHFLPGVSIDPATAGSSAHVALSFYSYAQTQCTASTCELFANAITSNDGGATWNAPTQLAGPMSVQWLAQTIDGAMVGDYSATTFVSGRATALLPLADPSRSGVFDEAMYAPKGGVLTLRAAAARRMIRELPVPGFHSDHPPKRLHP